MRLKNTASQTNSVNVDFQSLEPRQMLSAVTVSGSSSGEEIRVYVASNTIIVDVGGFPQSFPDFLYDGIVINALGGADTIIVDSNSDNAVTVNGGNGTDTIEIGKTDSSLAGIQSMVSVSSTGNTDTIIIHNESEASGRSYSVFPQQVYWASGPGSSVGILGSIASIVLNAGSGADTINVDNTDTPYRFELNGGDGADRFNMNFTSSSTTVVNGQAGLDLLQIGAAATVVIESDQDFSRIDAPFGGYLDVRGGAGLYLGTNQSDFEGNLFMGTGFLIEHNSQSIGGLNYWRDRLVGAQTNSTPQIRSLFADSSAVNDTIGYGYAQNLAITALAGFPLVSGDLVLRYTLRGDANLDSAVGFDDLLVLAQNYSTSTTGRVWTQGDYNLSGMTDFDDLLVLAQNYGTSALKPSRTPRRSSVNELA